MTDLAAKGEFKMKACTLYFNKGEKSEKSDKNLKTWVNVNQNADVT